MLRLSEASWPRSGSKVSEFLSAQGAPTSAIDAAKGSLGGANLVAARAPSSEQAARLLGVANSAFVDALHWSVIVAAIPVAIGAVCVYRFLPATARSEDLREQGIEFEAEHQN